MMKAARFPLRLTLALMLLPGLALAQTAGVPVSPSTPATATPTGDARGGQISRDGRIVAFWSTSSNLVTGDSNGTTDVFALDLAGGPLTRLSVTATGAQGNGASVTPAMSGDGRYVVFESLASNLVTGASAGSRQILVKDRISGTLTRASIEPSGILDGAENSDASISDDGTRVAFLSLIEAGGGFSLRVYVRDLPAGRTILASASAEGVAADDFSLSPRISADGRFVIFHSLARNLVPNANGQAQVYLKNIDTGAISVISSTAGGALGDATSFDGVLSADGRKAAFFTHASNLIPGGVAARQVMIKDIASGSLSLVTATAAGVAGNEPVSVRSNIRPISLSTDGRYVAMETRARNLIANDVAAVSQVLRKDMQTGQIVPVACPADGTGAEGASVEPSLSGDGQLVVFASDAFNLAERAGGAVSSVFVVRNPQCSEAVIKDVPQTGWWWNAAEPGRGFGIERRGRKFFVGGFLYDAAGQPFWAIAQGTGTRANLFQSTLDRFTGGQTLTGAYRAPAAAGSLGSLTFTATSPTTANLTWPGGSTALVRYPFGPGGAPGPLTPEPGWWWNPAEPGRGWFLENQGGQIFLAGFYYSDQGPAVWTAVQAAIPDGVNFSGTLTEYANGQTVGGPWRAPVVSAQRGNIAIRFSSSTTAQLTLPDGRVIPLERYRF